MDTQTARKAHLGATAALTFMSLLSLAFAANVLNKRNKLCGQDSMKETPECKNYGKDIEDDGKDAFLMGSNVWGPVIVIIIFSLFIFLGQFYNFYKHSLPENPFNRLFHIGIGVCSFIVILVAIIYAGSQHKDAGKQLKQSQEALEAGRIICGMATGIGATSTNCDLIDISEGFYKAYRLFHSSCLAVNIIQFLIFIGLFYVGSKIIINQSHQQQHNDSVSAVKNHTTEQQQYN